MKAPTEEGAPIAPSQPRRENNWAVGTLTYTTGGLVVLFCWLLWGDFAWSMRDRAIPPVMQLLFKKYGASDLLLGILFSSLPIALGLLTGPFISYFSDRHRGRWGRRIPYLMATTPFIVVSLVGLALSPTLGGWIHRTLGENSPGLNHSTLIFLGVFWIVFEFACGVANMVFGGLVNDVVPQTVVGRFYGFFRILSLIAGFLFTYWIIGYSETGYAWIFIGVGVLYGAGFTMMCLKVKEGQYPPPERPAEPDAPISERLVAAATVYLKDGYSHSYYLWFFAATILAGLAFTPFNLFSILYAKSLGMGITDYGKYQALTYAISLCLSYPLGALSDRFHPLRMTIAAIALYALTMLWCSLRVDGQASFAVALVAQSVLTGSFFTVSASLPQRLLPREKFASIGSAGGTISCLIGIAFAPALGLLLDHTGHDYRNTFYVGFVFAVLALIANLILHRRFMALGGPGHYVPPLSNDVKL